MCSPQPQMLECTECKELFPAADLMQCESTEKLYCKDHWDSEVGRPIGWDDEDAQAGVR